MLDTSILCDVLKAEINLVIDITVALISEETSFLFIQQTKKSLGTWAIDIFLPLGATMVKWMIEDYEFIVPLNAQINVNLQKQYHKDKNNLPSIILFL